MSSTKIQIRPWCPFCGQTVGKPLTPDVRKLGELATGRCDCGATYTCDPTGHNVGAAMVEALVCACNDNWDLAWELVPEDDYLTARLEDYDEQTNQIVESRQLDGRRISGVLYFIRLHRDIAEISPEAGKSRQQNGTEAGASSGKGNMPLEPLRDPKRLTKKADKNLVKQLVAAMDIDALVDLCFDDLKTLRFLHRLLYTPDDDMRWRTAHVIGKVCARYATRKPGKVSDLLHQLFAACSDSASSSWGAIETIGAIIAERPDIFGSFSRHLLTYLPDPTRQCQVLWALGAIAEQRPDLIRSTPFYNMLAFLTHPEPLCRGLAIRLFGRMQAKEAENRIKNLRDDQALVTIYEEGKAIESTLATLATQALERIEQKSAH